MKLRNAFIMIPFIYVMLHLISCDKEVPCVPNPQYEKISKSDLAFFPYSMLEEIDVNRYEGENMTHSIKFHFVSIDTHYSVNHYFGCDSIYTQRIETVFKSDFNDLITLTMEESGGITLFHRDFDYGFDPDIITNGLESNRSRIHDSFSVNGKMHYDVAEVWEFRGSERDSTWYLYNQKSGFISWYNPIKNEVFTRVN